MVALLFGLLPENGTVVVLMVATGISVVAALVSFTRMVERA
jgi:hypothetical protein